MNVLFMRGGGAADRIDDIMLSFLALSRTRHHYAVFFWSLVDCWCTSSSLKLCQLLSAYYMITLKMTKIVAQFSVQFSVHCIPMDFIFKPQSMSLECLNDLCVLNLNN